MQLITPTAAHLSSYVAALERGWSPNNIDSERHRLRELGEIAADPALFLGNMDDREAKAGDVELPDGSFIKRLPGIRRQPEGRGHRHRSGGRFGCHPL